MKKVVFVLLAFFANFLFVHAQTYKVNLSATLTKTMKCSRKVKKSRLKPLNMK